MHELSICGGVVNAAQAVLDELPPPPPRVSRVHLRVGRMRSVVPDSLRHYYALLVPGTGLDGSFLSIEEVPVRARCGDCLREFEIDELSFTCPFCRSGWVDLLSGRELDLVSLETVDIPPPEAPHGN